MRERAKIYHCADEVKQFETCCKDNSLLMIFFCRKPNEVLKDCLNKWYQNETFKTECKNIYLEDRTEYRQTGVLKKHRKAAAAAAAVASVTTQNLPQ
jgi:COX assembly mitochondrial protein 1